MELKRSNWVNFFFFSPEFKKSTRKKLIKNIKKHVYLMDAHIFKEKSCILPNITDTKLLWGTDGEPIGHTFVHWVWYYHIPKLGTCCT